MSILTPDGKLEAVIPVGQRPWGIAVTPDGRKLYTANGVSNTVSVVDLRARKVVATTPADAGTWGVAVVAARPAAARPTTGR